MPTFKVDDGILPLGFLLALLTRWAVSLYPYSGKGKSPMYGDYEAQRHWQEITWNIPVHQWYANSTKNDLMYWGLDYPPLTAYHSYLCAYMGDKFNSSWVKLFTSRGLESVSHKYFMRSTVFTVDVLIYMSAVFAFWFYSSQKTRSQRCSFIITLLYPGLLLIDHGHFQYNCVSLGFALWAIWAIVRDYDLLAAAAFTISLNYKQMELYHALPFFCYLLGSCIKQRNRTGVLKFFKLVLVVVAIFCACWYPFLWDMKTLKQVLNRLFPFNRGLFEDKVANIWCCLSLAIKLKSLLSIPTLAKISLITTVLAVLPSSLDLLLKPSKSRFKLALINSSLVFFLCSFQVHEKSILLAALPVCCWLPYYPLHCIWFLLISTFSMLPLLIKDHLFLPYLSTMMLFFVLSKTVFLKDDSQHHKDSPRIVHILFTLSMIGVLMLSFASILIPAPKAYPDIHAMLSCLYSCIHFILFALYFHWKQFSLSEDRDVLYDKKVR